MDDACNVLLNLDLRLARTNYKREASQNVAFVSDNAQVNNSFLVQHRIIKGFQVVTSGNRKV